jgi:outer membrane protein
MMDNSRVRARAGVPGLLVALGLIAGVAGSLAAKDFKLGYVDYDRVIAKYEAAVEAQKVMDTVRTSFEAKAESLKADYEKSQQEYESQQLTLSEEGKRAKMAEVDQRKKSYDAYVADVYGKGGKIDLKYKELIAPIVDKIDSATSRLAVDEGFALVLDASKAGVVYAQSGLDLTQLVIDDLNREFAPVGPTTNENKVFAIMPVYNGNDQAQQDHIGATVRQYAYQLISAQPKTDMADNAKVDQKLSDLGIQNQEVSKDTALDVARALEADYVVFGNCTKQDRKVSFELSIADARLGTLLKSQTGEAARVEDVQQKVADVIRVLLAAVEKP